MWELRVILTVFHPAKTVCSLCSIRTNKTSHLVAAASPNSLSQVMMMGEASKRPSACLLSSEYLPWSPHYKEKIKSVIIKHSRIIEEGDYHLIFKPLKK